MSSYHASKIVGKKIRYYRKMKGVSLITLGSVIGVSEQQQSRYELGINRLSVDRLEQYIHYFDINYDDLFCVSKIKEK